jgi:phenylacetic acid degradation operon negative regulatory protein
MRIEYEILFEFFIWGFETLSRRDCALILAGLRDTPSGRWLDMLLERLHAQRLLERQGRGQRARFSITPAAKRHVPVDRPAIHWDRPWDGKWRVFTFDLPGRQRGQRTSLWRALRAHKLGLLQRSVWIWPHDIQSILKEIISASGIPERFCGFESGKLFLCDCAEVVSAAWDIEEIARRHRTYLQHAAATPETLQRARDLTELARAARIEREAYDYAFSLDPLLPRVLWPKSYAGPAVAQRRLQFQSVLHRRLHELVG